MRKMHKIILPIIILILFSCSAAKRTARQEREIAELKSRFEKKEEENKAKYIAEYVKNNPCIYPEIDLDSLCEGYSDFKSLDFETFKDTNTIVKIKRVLTPYEDKRHIKLLQDSLYAIRTLLKECDAKATGKTEAVKEIVPLLVKKNKWEVNGWFWVALGLFFTTSVSMFFNIKKVL